MDATKMVNGSAMQRISLSKWLIIGGEEKDKILWVQYWNFYFIARITGERNNSTITENILFTSTSPLFLHPFLHPISLLPIFLIQDTFCINFSYSYLPYTSVYLLCNVQDSQNIVNETSSLPHALCAIYFIAVIK